MNEIVDLWRFRFAPKRDSQSESYSSYPNWQRIASEYEHFIWREPLRRKGLLEKMKDKKKGYQKIEHQR